MIMHKRFKPKELALLISLGCVMSAPAVMAQEPKKEDVVELETYTAEGQVEDTMGVMSTEPVKSVFGFGKTILETPRGVTSVSADMMESYNITNINDLVMISPGAFTQSFFGVAGSLDVRGTPGEVYFRGVRRLNNPGNYPTPIAATDRVDIVRGPASPIYGPSKIGGYLNFEPKAARAETGAYLDKPTGGMSVTKGSWDKNILTAEVGGPANVGSKKLGYYVYAETENSGSYYNNSATDQNILQVAFNMDLTENTRIEWGGMRHEYAGNQIAGWNRLTQDLIDNGTYITGTPESFDYDGDGYWSPAEAEAYFGVDGFSGGFWVAPGAVTDADANPKWALQNVGTTKLKHNQTLVSPEDRLETDITTYYFDIIHTTDGGLTITNKSFYESLDNINENAYGFSQFVDSWAFENQTVFAFEAQHSDWLKGSYQISPSIRHTDFIQGDDFDYEYFDRRDISGPNTPADKKLLATRTNSDFAGYRVGNYTDYGLAFLADYGIGESLNVLVGARYDYLEIESEMVEEMIRVKSNAMSAEAEEDGISWTASVSYKLPFGLTPYVTVSEQATIVMGQGSEINPDLVRDGNALADSELTEVGVKGSFLDDRLFMSLAAFEQTRVNYSAQDLVSNNTTESKGYEFEARFLATSHFTVTAAVTHLEISNLTALNGGSQYGFVGAGSLTGVTDPSLFYGIKQGGLTFVNSKEQALKAGIPENMYSLTGAYKFDSGVRLTASVIHADETYSGFARAVKLPSYTLLNAGINYDLGDWSLSLQGKNLTDEKYYRANFPDLFGSAVAMPELPRNYTVTASYKF